MAQYKVLGELGRGGMGVVYRAIQTTLGREVAMKVVLAGKDADERYLRRFEREIEILIRSEHPNIVRVFDQGMSEGRPFFVMELIRGRSLQEVLTSSGAMSPERIVHLLRQLVSALDHCHRKGLIHRDVKPRNVMLGDEDHIWLMDFGLVLDPHRTALTREGQIIGTPRFLAPESILEGEYSPASDLYSTGQVAYEMATGRPAIPRGLKVEEVLAFIVKEPPRPISELRPDFPPALETLVMSMLEKDPAARPPVPDVLRRLEELAAGTGWLRAARTTRQSGRARPTGPSSAGSPAASGSRARIAGAGVFLAVTVLGLSRLAGPASPPRNDPAPPAASAAARSAEAPPAKAVDFVAEYARFRDLSQRVRDEFRFQGFGERDFLSGARSLSNAPEMVPRLHELVTDLDGLVGRSLGPGPASPPETILMVKILQHGLSPVMEFFGVNARSEALARRVQALARHVPPGETDPCRRAVGRVLPCLVDLVLEVSFTAQEKIARAYVDAFDDTRGLDPDWLRTPAAVACRTSFIEEACLRHLRSRIETNLSETEFTEDARRRLVTTLRDLSAALDSWPRGDPELGNGVVAHSRALGLHLLRARPDRESARPLIDVLQGILTRVPPLEINQKQKIDLARQAEILRKEAGARGLSFAIPADLVVDGTGG